MFFFLLWLSSCIKINSKTSLVSFEVDPLGSEKLEIDENIFLLFNTYENFSFTAQLTSNGKEIPATKDAIAIACNSGTILTVKNTKSTKSTFEGGSAPFYNAVYSLMYFSNHNSSINIPIKNEINIASFNKAANITFAFLGNVSSQNKLSVSVSIKNIKYGNIFAEEEEITNRQSYRFNCSNQTFLRIYKRQTSSDEELFKVSLGADVSSNYNPANKFSGVYQNDWETKFLTKSDLTVDISESKSTSIVLIIVILIICIAIGASVTFLIIKFNCSYGEKKEKENENHSKIKNDLINDDDESGDCNAAGITNKDSSSEAATKI